MYIQIKKKNNIQKSNNSILNEDKSISEEFNSFKDKSSKLNKFHKTDEFNSFKDKSSKLNKFHKLKEENIDFIIEEIKEFAHLYLFKGNINLPLDVKVTSLFNISKDDLTTLKVVHFFLSDEIKELINILPYLLRNLSHSTHKEIEEYRGVIKGKIDWNSTFKTRYSKGFDDKSLFVCSPSAKFYNLEENQLLKFLLKKIIFLRDNYLNFVNINNDKFNFELLSEELDWYNIVSNNYQMTKWALKKVYFDDIDDLKQIKPKYLRKALKNRNPLYQKVVKAYILFEDLFINDDDKVLMELVEKRLIRAADPDKLYEIYVFFNLIKTLPGDVELKLLHKSNAYSMSTLLEDNTKITVHYQYTPEVFRKISEYLEIIDNYEIRGSTRAPDCMIEFEKEGNKYYRIVEVKNTSDESYVRASVYKVMGYYRDFERVKSISGVDFTSNIPVILVTWGGISLKEDYNPFNDKFVILNRNEFINNLDKIIGL